MSSYNPPRVRIVNSFSSRKAYDEVDLGDVLDRKGVRYEVRGYDGNNREKMCLGPQPIALLRATLQGIEPLMQGTIKSIYLRPIRGTTGVQESKPVKKTRRRMSVRELERAMEGNE